MRRSSRSTGWLFLVGAGAAVAGAGVLGAGCGDVSCQDNQTCTPGDLPDGSGGDVVTVDGGGDVHLPDGKVDGNGQGEGGVDAPGDSPADTFVADTFMCDPNAEPSAQPCVISEGYGVFVSPTGDDGTGTGTRTKPFKTVSHALANLGGHTRVYACEGTYADQITITSAVSVYGGLSCEAGATPWTYNGHLAKITATSADFGVKISGVSSGALVIADVEVDGATATAAGGTSVAVLVTGSQGVTLRRVKVVGGTGADGEAGIGGLAAPNYAQSTAPNGNAATTAIGGLAQPNSCVDMSASTGGGAGNALANGSPGAPAVTPSLPSANTGANGDTTKSCGSGGSGGDGSNGPGGTSGAGETSLGVYVLASGAWVPANGGNGGNGQVAQGGGGGAGKTGGGGGGGGAGGCGGTAGRGGNGGGGSFGILSVNSSVILDHASVSGGKAGAGGKGGDGESGQPGGNYGAGAAPGCAGGAGGMGGGGGGGGGGAGGLSAAIGYVGTVPSSGVDTTVTPFAGGAANGGPGGKGGSGASGVAGTDGASGAAGQQGDVHATFQVPAQ